MAAPANEATEGAAAAAAPEEKQPEQSSFKSKMAAFGKTAQAMAKEVGQKAKESAVQAKEDLDARLTMEGQLKAARTSLALFLSPTLEAEKQIPVELMKGAKGIVFLSSLKASFGLGASIGSGIIMSRLDYDAGWSGPCSIGLLGGQWGFNIGAQKTDFIIILRDADAVKLFSGKGQIKFGADASIAAGPHGRDAQIAVGANDKGYAATMSYSMAKGLYVGLALEGQGITVRDECNEKFYGKKVECKDILVAEGGAVKNEDYDAICELLTNYSLEQDQAAAMEDGGQAEAKQPL